MEVFRIGRYRIKKRQHQGPYHLYELLNKHRPRAREDTNFIRFEAVESYIIPGMTEQQVAELWSYQTDTEGERYPGLTFLAPTNRTPATSLTLFNSVGLI